jgi:predicted negative regulator of RcsB-dependent stress response
MKVILTLLAISVFAVGCAQTPATKAPGAVDFGNYTSETLTTNAWRAMDRGDYATALIYTDKCIELYKDEALKMQADIHVKRQHADVKKKQTNQEVFANWALNDVGTSYFIKGEALMNMGKEEEAVEAYKVVMNQLYYANTYDPQGWFWSPAEAATKKVVTLSQDF